MITSTSEPATKTPLSENNGTNGQAASVQPEWPVHEFQPGLGDHPLWQEFLDALEASRQADIAEANRLADLELIA